MAYHIATIQVLIDVEDQGQACDAMSETIRPLLREFAGADSCWIDWRYLGGNSADGAIVPVLHSGDGFEYATEQSKATISLKPEQRAALLQFERALRAGTECGLFDVMAGYVHPDDINRVADAATQMQEELEPTPQEIAAQFGCYIGHDIGGWYIADESEREKDERGTSVGFDGRPHYETEQAAANALQEAKEPQALLKAD